MKFYHVDRNVSLREKQIIQLIKWDDITPVQLQNHIDELFPEGVSSHGNIYLLGNKWDTEDNSRKIELIYEYVRRSYFPHRTSRFQSFFAFDNLTQAEHFRESQNRGFIWLVECDQFFKADINMLQIGTSPLSCSYYAHQYWQGSGAKEPNWECLLTPPVTILDRIK